jgi:type IV pilus assembly protein PilC
MLETGVTISDALESISRQAEKPHVKAVLEDVAMAVGRGDDLSTAVGRQPRSFPRIFVALVRASEKGGMLPRMIERANGYLRDEQEIIRKVRGALTYPAIMFTFALMTCIFMLAFILPRFTVLYRGKEHLLPVPTKVLLTLSGVITQHWGYLLIGTAMTGAIAWQWLRSEGGREAWHRLQLRIPLLGPMFRKLHLSRGLRMIGTLAGAGVGLVDCLENAEQLAGNRLYARLWSTAGSRIRQGMPFSESLRSSPLVPPSISQMLHSGEMAGKLAIVTERVAEHAETELKESITEITRYIEPAMIVAMGALIGGMTMAMLLPVFTVSRVMGH